MADQLTRRLKEQEIDLELTEEAIDKIAEEGFDPEYGARPLRRAIQKHIEDRLSEELLKGVVQKGQKVTLDVDKGEFVVKSIRSKRASAKFTQTKTRHTKNTRMPLLFILA